MELKKSTRMEQTNGGYKDRAEVKTYNNMFKNYQSAMKQLNDLLIQSGTSYNDDFDNF